MENLTLSEIAAIQYLMQMKFTGSEFTAVATPIVGTEDFNSVDIILSFFRVDSGEYCEGGKIRGFIDGGSSSI